eukprot:TRINITY_DN33106_c0_g1_i1.p1 TRINITY_DN33106_c0_g1~~TRINITY_DN33106_c0_g1_i1.p1  ORF type:complete len:311 (+),score=-23.39 TRINITY_DN33106_c0_g1_i1:195-1127(+)
MLPVWTRHSGERPTLSNSLYVEPLWISHHQSRAFGVPYDCKNDSRMCVELCGREVHCRRGGGGDVGACGICLHALKTLHTPYLAHRWPTDEAWNQADASGFAYRGGMMVLKAIGLCGVDSGLTMDRIKQRMSGARCVLGCCKKKYRRLRALCVKRRLRSNRIKTSGVEDLWIFLRTPLPPPARTLLPHTACVGCIAGQTVASPLPELDGTCRTQLRLPVGDADLPQRATVRCGWPVGVCSHAGRAAMAGDGLYPLYLPLPGGGCTAPPEPPMTGCVARGLAEAGPANHPTPPVRQLGGRCGRLWPHHARS